MTREKIYPSEEQERFIVRFPDGMRDRLKEAAAANNRSMNAEIVARLQESFGGISADFGSESHKLELLNEYIEWCERAGRLPETSHLDFCKAYAQAYAGDTSVGIRPVPGFAALDGPTISALHLVWMGTRPVLFPKLQDVKPGRATEALTKLSNDIAEARLTSISEAKTGELIDELLRRFPPGLINIRIGKDDEDGQ